jgi:hypothetical protein
MKPTTGNGEFEAKKTMTKSIVFVGLVAALILLVPLVAMQFTDEVVWDLVDFAVAGALLIGTGLLYAMAVRKISSTKYRIVAGIALAVAFLLVWVELAVGIIGS